jgi:hypothetical protein
LFGGDNPKGDGCGRSRNVQHHPAQEHRRRPVQQGQTGSAVAALSGAEPQQFGEVTHMTLTGRPRAEYVGEGADKSSTNATFGTKVVTPHKVQVTQRFNEEVQWADEDYQLGVLDASPARAARPWPARSTSACSTASTRSPAPRSPRSSSATGSHHHQLRGDHHRHPDDPGPRHRAGRRPGHRRRLRAQRHRVRPTYAWTIATARYADGRKKYPELGFGANITAFEGLSAYSSSTVSATPEAREHQRQGHRRPVGPAALGRPAHRAGRADRVR